MDIRNTNNISCRDNGGILPTKNCWAAPIITMAEFSRFLRIPRCRLSLSKSRVERRNCKILESSIQRGDCWGTRTTMRKGRGRRRRCVHSTFNANIPAMASRITLMLLLFCMLIMIISFPSALQAKIVLMEAKETMKPDEQLAPLELDKSIGKDASNNDGKQQQLATLQNNSGGGNDLVGLLDANDTEDGDQFDADLLRLDKSASLPRFFYASGGAPSTQAHISRESWERYQRFKEETCRKGTEEYLAEKALNSTESGYFHWEENEFHRELRDRLLPQTRSGSFRSLVGSPLLSHLDPRLFTSEPRSLCQAKRHTSEADEKQKLAKEEQHLFEDFLINKVFSPAL